MAVEVVCNLHSTLQLAAKDRKKEEEEEEEENKEAFICLVISQILRHVNPPTSHVKIHCIRLCT